MTGSMDQHTVRPRVGLLGRGRFETLAGQSVSGSGEIRTGLRVLVLLVLIAALWSGRASGSESDPAHINGHLKLAGVVTQVRSGVIFVKTPAGEITIPSTTGLGALNPGQRLSLTINENNLIIDVHQQGAGTVERHRIVHGILMGQQDAALTLRSSDGDKRFPLAQSVQQLRSLAVGSAVTVEVDEAGRIVDLHPAEVSMTLVRTPRLATGMHVKVSGTVSAIRSGIVFVKTPFGVLTLHHPSRRRILKPDDQVSLWVDEDNYVIDVHGVGDGWHHRMIRGMASYVDDERTKIRLVTPAGAEILLLDEAADKSTVLPEDVPVLVELNEANAVIDIHDDR